MSKPRTTEVDLLAIRDHVERVVADAPWVDLENAVVTKAGANPQTTLDLEADAYLHQHLPTVHDAPILSEEDPMATLSTSGRNWVIDPIDGTINAMRRLRHIAMSTALVDSASMEAEVGVVRIADSPKRPESIFSAVVGHGAQRDGQPFRTATQKLAAKYNTRLVAFGVPGHALGGDTPEVLRYEESFLKIYRAGWHTVQNGSACIEICRVANGQLPAFFEYGLHLWDFAAALLIAKEAGCATRIIPVTTPGSTERSLMFDVLVAKNKKVLGVVAELTGIKEAQP